MICFISYHMIINILCRPERKRRTSSPLATGMRSFASLRMTGPRPAVLGCRLGRAGRCVAFGEVEDLDEGRRLLGAGDRVLAVDDEAGHAVDAEAAGIDVGGDDLLAALVAHQVAAGGGAPAASAGGPSHPTLPSCPAPA